MKYSRASHFFTQVNVSDVEFDTNHMDDNLYKEGLDWTFEKPPPGTQFSRIYIVNKVEDSSQESNVRE